MLYEIIIVGAGPAGLMAAIAAAQAGAKVLVVEKNSRPGLKLLATGGGRCNLTNLSLSDLALAETFGREGRFLLSAIKNFNPAAVVDFFESKGLKTAVEGVGQVFPASGKAKEVLDLLLTEAKTLGVEFVYDFVVSQLARLDNHWRLESIGGQSLESEKLILATGGKSYPATGSSGDAYAWLQQLGHTIIEPRPALTPLLATKSVKMLEGLSLPLVELKYSATKPAVTCCGPIIFTAEGLSGPGALNFSRLLPLASAWSEVTIDLLPTMTMAELEQELSVWRQQEGAKLLRNLFSRLLPPRLADLLLAELGLIEIKMADLSAEQRRQLLAAIKNWAMPIKGLLGFEKAMVTAGGLALSEVDQRRLESKLQPGLFVVGELLNLDGPTGGYNLQMCWCTGLTAGRAAAE